MINKALRGKKIFFETCFLWSLVQLVFIYKHASQKLFEASPHPPPAHLSNENCPIVFFSTWKFIYGDDSIRIKRGLQINLTLSVVWNLHSTIKTWSDKYTLEEWSYQQNALEDNKTPGERIVCIWDDGSVICKADSINLGHQCHRRNSSPSLMSLVPSQETAGPAAH